MNIQQVQAQCVWDDAEVSTFMIQYQAEIDRYTQSTGRMIDRDLFNFNIKTLSEGNVLYILTYDADITEQDALANSFSEIFV